MIIPVPNGKKYKIKLTGLFFPLLLFIVVVIIFVKFSEIKEIGRVFSQAKWYFLVLALASQWLNIALQTAVYQNIFKTLKFYDFSFSKLMKATVTIIFLNYTIPSFGFAGNIYFLKILKKCGLKEGTGLLSIIVEFICYYLAFIALLILSLFYLFFKLHYIGMAQKVAVAGFAVLICLIAFMVYFWLGNKERSKKRVLWLAKKIDKAEDGIQQEERVRMLLNDFYADFEWLKKNKTKIFAPTLIQFFKFLADGLTIYLIFLAFGIVPLIGLPLVAFALGRLFGLISFVPGGVGAFEGSMVLIFNSLGIQLELALAVMLIYRFFSFWLYFPLGLIFYRRMNGEKSIG